MTNVLWDMILCEQGAVAIVVKGDALLRVCFKCSAQEVSAEIKRLHPLAKQASVPLIKSWLDQVREYFVGERQFFSVEFADVALSDFARKVHQALAEVPYGQVVTYGELAAKVGSPMAARAVGRVMSSNPFPLIVPCHRVVNADGSIGQYSAGDGTTTKAWLIDFENNCAVKSNSSRLPGR
jgi:methylated-DNA-[protein]-cysteine S-methyltransferase